MRHLRAMKDRTAVPIRVEPFTFEAFAALPHRLPVAGYAVIERRAAVVTGYIQHALRASDGDMHLEIIPEPDTTGAGTLYLTGEITPAMLRGSRNWAFGALVATLRPDFGTLGPWVGGPRRARIRGWLLYDFQHDDSLGHWTSDAVPRMTGWEIHPVTGIELWSDSLARFVEYPR